MSDNPTRDAIFLAIQNARPFASIIYMSPETLYEACRGNWTVRPNVERGTFNGVKLRTDARYTGWAVGVPCPVCDSLSYPPCDPAKVEAFEATFRRAGPPGNERLVCNACDGTTHKIVAQSADWSHGGTRD